ncbi:hypothetical protein [Chitinimonas taiwanensis]|uniref:hypothetical protein n=1 Tax=Chitinimonas taiwanensis TaxID=240412 RepID=UPI0035AE8DC3
MSEYLKLSTLPNDHPWPPTPSHYPYQYEQLTEEPGWEQACLGSKTIGLNSPAWEVLCRSCIPRLPADECLVLQTAVLMMFNGDRAKSCAQRLSPLPRSVDREIQALVNRNPSLVLAEIRRDVLSIKNALADWLGTLPPGQLGVARMYDWGKY